MSKKQAIQKNIQLNLDFDQYAVRHMDIYDYIPNGSWVIMTYNKDPHFNRESRSWVKRVPSKKIVEAYKVGRTWKIRPLVVPQ